MSFKNLGDEYYEVGNLVITSRFKANGTGVVNLKWEVPENLIGKIRGNFKKNLINLKYVTVFPLSAKIGINNLLILI